MSYNPFAQDLEAQVVAESTGAPPLPQRPADSSILEQSPIDSPLSYTHTPTSMVPQIRINEEFPQNSAIHHIPDEEVLPDEAPPVYSEIDPNPSPTPSPHLSAQSQYSEENRPPTPQRPHSPSYQRPAVPPPLHLDTTSYNRPQGPPPQHLPAPPSANPAQRPVSPRLPPRPSSQYPGRSGATYENRPQLPQRPY